MKLANPADFQVGLTYRNSFILDRSQEGHNGGCPLMVLKCIYKDDDIVCFKFTFQGQPEVLTERFWNLPEGRYLLWECGHNGHNSLKAG